MRDSAGAATRGRFHLTDRAKLRDQYDWIVLGEHPGALLTAGLAARLGLSVLVLPLVPGARTAVSEGGQWLDPEPNFVLGLGGEGLLAECLKRLGMADADRGHVRAEGVAPQIATPELRLGFASEREALRRELDREFGAKRAAELGLLAALAEAEKPSWDFWKALPSRLTLTPQEQERQKGQKQGWGLSELSRRFVPSPEAPASLDALRRRLERSVAARGRSSADERRWFRKGLRAGALGEGDWNGLCRALWFGVAGNEEMEPELSELLHLLAVSRTGAAYQGGLSAYRNFLLRLATKLGAHVPEKAECRRLFVEEGRFVGVQILNRGNMISGTGAVLGCSLAHVKEHLSASGGSKWSKGRALKPAPRPQGWKFTLALTVHAEAIPPGLGQRLVWQESGAPLLEFEVVDPADYGISEPEHRWLFVRTMMPFTPESLSVPYQRMIAARMLRQLTELLPFLEFHVVRIYPDFRGENDELSKVYGFASVDLIPENLRAIRGRGVGSRSGLEGLFVATGESFPELGTLGPTAAALEAVSWIAHRRGLAGPFA